MKKTLTLGTIVLGCCLVAFAQYSNQAPSGSSTSGYSQDQAGPSQSYPSSSADQMQSYPSGSADQSYSEQSANQKTTVQGCLTQSADGNFMLADTSGNVYQLNDSSARLGLFVGQEVRVDGFGIFNSEANLGAMASSANQRAQQIDVSRVHKVAESCQSSFGQ